MTNRPRPLPDPTQRRGWARTKTSLLAQSSFLLLCIHRAPSRAQFAIAAGGALSAKAPRVSGKTDISNLREVFWLARRMPGVANQNIIYRPQIHTTPASRLTSISPPPNRKPPTAAEEGENGPNMPLQEHFHRGILRESQKHSRHPVKQGYEISPVNGKIGHSPPPEPRRRPRARKCPRCSRSAQEGANRPNILSQEKFHRGIVFFTGPQKYF